MFFDKYFGHTVTGIKLMPEKTVVLSFFDFSSLHCGITKLRMLQIIIRKNTLKKP